MTTATLQQIGELLSEVDSPGTFSAKRTRPVDDLHLEVKGVGRLRFPVPRSQAKQLCQIGRPARYGRCPAAESAGCALGVHSSRQEPTGAESNMSSNCRYQVV